MKTELLPDRGAAARSEDFFRCEPFLAAEGTTHTLAIGGARVPLVVREIPEADGLRDAISPYGYPGGTSDEGAEAPDPSAVDFSATGLVSLFVRERIGGEPSLAGGRRRSLVQVHDPRRERRVRSRVAEQVRRNERQGWVIDRAAGPEATELQRATFLSLYTETMSRAEASARYFFDASYFEQVLSFPRSWVLLARSDEHEIGAGAIAALSDGILHYYLGGTADRALDASPFKNVVVAMMDLADELGTPLNLGGGMRPGDGLEDFKRGFANAELPFMTHEIVSDAAAYERLSSGRDADEFFPAYRASA